MFVLFLIGEFQFGTNLEQCIMISTIHFFTADKEMHTEFFYFSWNLTCFLFTTMLIQQRKRKINEVMITHKF